MTNDFLRVNNFAVEPPWHYAGQSIGTDCVGFVQRCIAASEHHSEYFVHRSNPLGEHTWTCSENEAKEFTDNRTSMYCAEDGKGKIYLNSVTTVIEEVLSKIMPGDIFYYYTDTGSYHMGIIDSVDYNSCIKRSSIDYDSIVIIESTLQGDEIANVTKYHTLEFYTEGDWKKSWKIGRLLQ